jgi:hypothetical protein
MFSRAARLRAARQRLLARRRERRAGRADRAIQRDAAERRYRDHVKERGGAGQ